MRKKINGDKKLTLTDKLLGASVLMSVAVTVFHASLPAIVCTAVHIAVTVLGSIVHIKKLKTNLNLS